MKRKRIVSYIFTIAIAFHALSVTTYANAQIFYNLASGWNLLANAGSASIAPSTTFGDSTKFSSVSKWNMAESKWLFFSQLLE